MRWTVSATDVPAQSPPVTDGADVYVGGQDGALLAYNAGDGAPSWRDLTETGHVYAVDAATGSVLRDHANQAAGG